MLHGKVVRGRAIPNGADLDQSPNVTVVRDNDFVGVAAPTLHEAEKAADAIRAKYPAESASSRSSHQSLFEDLRRGVHVDAAPAIEAALTVAHHKLDNSYTIAYIAHAPLEPRAHA